MIKDIKFLRLLRNFSIVEGVSTLLLFFVAMPLKYMAGIPMAVSVVGPLHGALFMGLVAMYFMAYDRVPLSGRMTAAGILGAIVPFGPFVLDHRLKRLERQ